MVIIEFLFYGFMISTFVLCAVTVAILMMSFVYHLARVALAAIVIVPLGIVCGAYDLYSRFRASERMEDHAPAS